MDKRRRRWLTGIAIGSAVLLVTGVLQPLPLSLGAAHADDAITEPLQNVIDNVDGDVGDLEDALDAANSAATALQTNATTFLGQLNSIVATAPSDPAAALTALESAAAAEAPALAETGLTQALELASKVVAPSCTTLGALSSLLPSLGLGGLGLSGLSGLLDAILGPLAAPLDQLNSALSNTVQNYYTQAFTALLTPVTLPAGASGAQQYVTLAQDLLSLLKMNWHTTYYPPGGGTPVVRDTPGFLGLPTPIDVDGKLGPDVCGLMNYSTSTGAVTQSISRLPLTAAFPMDIAGQFLDNALSAGYLTQGSAAPSRFQTTITVGALAAGGSGSGSTTDTKLSGAGPTFTQTAGLSSAVQLTLASTKPPATYHFASSTPGGSSGSGTQLNYTGSSPSTKFAFSTTLGGLNLGVAQTPGATSFEYCTSSKGFCSNEPAASTTTETGSMHFLANHQVVVDQTSSAGATTCPGSAVLGDAHLTGTELYLAQNSAAAGHVWVDTGGKPVSGCLATASTTGTLPVGFLATQRSASWTGESLFSAGTATAKSGTITCPTGTTVKGGALGIAVDLERYFCSFPPVAGTPTITAAGGHFNVGVIMTGNMGTWMPTAPNLPTFTTTWSSCTSTNVCSTVATNTNTYTPQPSDQGNTLKFSVTGTNLDGTTPAASAPTTAIGAPIPPNHTANPAISGTRHVGDSLTATPGTWDQTGLTFTYQWQRCTGIGTGCANVGTATTSASYPLTTADEGQNLQVVVTAKNPFNATNTATSNSLFVPPPPTNNAAPAIQDGANSNPPVTVLQGDNLTLLNPPTNWNYAETFSYQWFSCPSNSICTNQVATTAGYQPQSSDVNNYLTVTVTAHNPNGTASATAAFTNPVLSNPYVPGAPNLNSVPDGTVYASTPSAAGDYIGGSFDTIGPRVGGAGAVPGTPTTISNTPSLAALVSGGSVNAVASDGAGGYFLGGSFTSVLGASCPGIAHLTTTGTVDPGYCQSAMVGTVKALDYVHGNFKIGSSTASAVNLLAVGGSFTDGTHSNLILLDPAGTVAAPANEPQGVVNSITDDSGITVLVKGSLNFIAGGAFNQLGTGGSATAAKNLMTVTMALAQPATGTAATVTGSTYPGGVDCGAGKCTNPVVNAVFWTTTTLLAPEVVFGGTFDTYYLPGALTGTGTPRSNAAAISEPSANQAPAAPTAVGNWNPAPNGPVTAISGGLGAVYLAGGFTSVTNTTTYPVKGLVEYGIGSTGSGITANNNPNAAGTTATSSPNTMWTPSVDNGQVLSMVPGDSGLYLGGSFTSISSTVRHRLAHVTSPSATPPAVDAWDPNAGQTVNSLARYAPSSGSPSIFVGGNYVVLGGTTRNHVAEMKKDGTLTGWAPAGTAAPVRALVTDGTNVYAGGDGSGSAPNLVAVKVADASTLFSDTTNNTVRALALGAGGLYLGGDFTSVGMVGRSHLAAVSLTDGSLQSWSPTFTGTTVNALAANATAVYVGGSGLTAFSPTTGAPTGWAPAGFAGTVNALALTGTTVYVGGAFTVSGGPSNAAEFDSGTGALITTWNPSISGTVRSLALVGSSVLIGGDFGAVQVDGTSGATSTTFAPNPNGLVYSISVSPTGLIGIFGPFTNIGGAPTYGYGFYGGS